MHCRHYLSIGGRQKEKVTFSLLSTKRARNLPSPPWNDPGEGLTITISPRGWALRFWEYVCRPGWALFDSWGKWDVQKWMTPPSHHRMGEVGSEAHLSVAPTPRYTCSSPQPTQSDRVLFPLQHQSTKPCDPPILTAGSTTRVSASAALKSVTTYKNQSCLFPNLLMPEVLIII